MWWVAGAALWLAGAWALALLLGAVVHRSRCAARPSVTRAPAVRRGPVPVPAPRSAPPATPPSGMRSQGYLSCAAPVRPRP